MGITTVSTKYQVVIPKEARLRLHIKKGQKMIVLVKDNIITLIPDRPLSELKGFVKGINKKDIREKTERI